MSEHTPGVRVIEVDSGPRPIQAVGTSTAGFVGRAPSASAHAGQPMRVNNWQHFLRLFQGSAKSSNPLSLAVHGFFMNGGSSLFVCNVAEDALAEGLDALGAIDEIAIVAAPGRNSAADYEAVIAHCERLGDRFAILDGPDTTEDTQRLLTPATTGGGEAASGGLRPRKTQYGAVYFPWLTVMDPMEGGKTTTTAPSGHLAGLYARVDAAEGVHKAPANAPLRGALGLTQTVTRAEQSELNRAGVNCIRFFPSDGILVWGARTLEPNGPYRYINVRRLVNMIKESIAEGTRWVVFQPNDESLWKSITRDVTAFLLRIARTGAFRGPTPEAGFFVQCDAETNPRDEVDAGRVTTVIGVAPSTPAEFVIFKLGQTDAGPEVGAEGVSS